MRLAERETCIEREFLEGNVPTSLRNFVPVRVRRVDANQHVRTVTFFVLPDYVALGSDEDRIRVPMTPRLGQRLADRVACALPTRRMVDDIWAAARVQLEPVAFSPNEHDITSFDLFWRHDQRIERQRSAATSRGLVAGIKKDVVVSRRITSSPGRVVIYGWHRRNGRAIQPLYSGHVAHYVDYSHGVRLVHDCVLVDGEVMPLRHVLSDTVLHPLLSDEGPVRTSRY